MKFRFAAVTAGMIVVLGGAGALVARANIAARDALYIRPASLGPDEVYGGVAYSAEPWPSVLAVGVIAAVVGAATLLILWATRAALRRRVRISA